MSKNSSDSYGEAQKGVLRMARVNCNNLAAEFCLWMESGCFFDRGYVILSPLT